MLPGNRRFGRYETPRDSYLLVRSYNAVGVMMSGEVRLSYREDSEKIVCMLPSIFLRPVRRLECACYHFKRFP